MSTTTRLNASHIHSGPQSNGHGVSSQKSHVLAGVQDAYWSDDETEDADCPLCLEEMDLSDINFKPCPCGYQICRFCWHHIKENLNGRCPACRREYTEESVEFKAISRDDQKRLNQQKRLRDRERKELEQLKRSHLVNVRVVQRNLVYVTGLGSRFAKEELIPSLRSTEYFGKYGKISKIVLVKRTASASQAPVVGLYITYHRREDAARAIAAVDGTASPGTDGEVMRASYGTTKYCMSFLRGVSCTSQGCLGLHEWGEDRDCFTKEDLTTLKHAMKDTESRPRHIAVSQARKLEETDSPALPRTASWGQKGATTPVTTAATPAHLPIPSATSNRNTRSNGRSSRSTVPNSTGRTPPSDAPVVSNARTRAAERRNAAAQAANAPTGLAALPSRPSTPSAASLPSRPSTSSGQSQAPQAPSTTSSPVGQTAEPARIASPPVTTQPPTPTTPSKSRKGKNSNNNNSPSDKSKKSAIPIATVSTPAAIVPASPIPAVARVQGIRSDSVPPLSPSSTAAESVESTQTPPPPPGLALPAPQSAYQMSTQAQALIDDVLNRRHSVNPSEAYTSPFPDFDRTLSNLGDGEFSFDFNIDPKLVAKAQESVAEFAPSSPVILSGAFDPFSSAPVSFVPPGISPRRPPSSASFAHSPLSGIHEPRPSFATSPSYAGSFNPFAETNSPSLSVSSLSRAQSSPFEDDPLKRGSRFGFAQRKDSTNSALGQQSATSSPLRFSDTLPSTPSFSSSDVVSPQPQMQQQHDPSSWAYHRQSEYGLPPGVPINLNGYEAQQQQQSPRNLYQNMNIPRGDPFGGYGSNSLGSDGALHLKELLHLDRRQEALRNSDHLRQQQSFSNQGFIDPAIMSMRINPSYEQGPYGMNSPNVGNSPSTPYGGPPGLTGQMGPPPGMGPIDLGHFNHLHQGNNARSPSVASSNPTHGEPFYFAQRRVY